MSEKRSGEDGILDLIAKYFPNRHPHMLLGRGDDCALMTVPQAAALGNSALFAVTSDILRKTPISAHRILRLRTSGIRR